MCFLFYCYCVTHTHTGFSFICFLFCFVLNLRLTKINSKNNSSSNKGEPIFHCNLCPKNVTDNDNAVLCDLCQTWVHIKCNHLSCLDRKYLQGCNKPWYWLSCTNTLFPFGNLNNQSFLNLIGNNNTITSSETKNLDSSLLIMSFLKTAVIQKM